MRANTLFAFLFLLFQNTILAQSTHWDSLYNYINDTLIAKQRYDEAHTLSILNLKTAETVFGKTHYKYHQSSYQLGQIYYFKKDFKSGITVLENSCLILEANPYKDSVFYGKALNLMGICYKRVNDTDKAEAQYIKAYQSLAPIKTVFPREFSACLNNLAVLYYELGRTDEAIDFTTQALSYVAKNSESYIARLGTLSLLYKRKGRFKEALFMAQEALKLTDKKHPQYDQRIGTLSSLYADIGLLDKAYELTKEAYDIVGQTKGKNTVEYANWSKNLSILNTQLGRYEQALTYAQQAQNIEENRKDRPEYYFYQAQVANCYIHLGQSEKALPLLTEALDKLAIKPGRKSEAYLNAMGNLIRLHQKKGDIAKAVALNKEELDLVKAAWSDTDDRYFVAQMRLIELYNTNGQYAESTQELKLLVQKLNNQVLYNIDVLDELGKEQFIANFVKDFEPLLFSHIKNNTTQDTALLTLAFETELAMKGIILSSSQLFKQIANKQQNAVYKSWEKQKDALSKAYTRHAGQRQIDSLNAELGTIEEKLIASTPELQHIQRKTARFKDIQQNLKPDACAIEFVRFQHHNNHRWTDTFYYAALIVKPHQAAPDCVFLCNENELKTLIGKNKNAQQLYATRGNTEGVAILPSKTLYNLIWKPLQTHLMDVKTVHYATAGILHQIAFAALPIDETNLLSDLFQLNTLSSTRTILQKSEAVKIDNVTLYGGILYDEKEHVSTNPNAWAYLSGTKKEVGKIAMLLSNKHIKNEIKEGEFASESSFKVQNTEGGLSPTVLHIATHGFFYQNIIGTMQKGVFSFQNAKNPLVRSGLIMANANAAWLGKPIKDGEEDGILTAYEIANINLSNTKVVILSACETGLGDVQGSEGVYGLQRAFKMAGLDYILMSLWTVPDKQTAELMEKFYTFWLKGNSIETAFNLAQQDMRTRYLPYYWAGFVLMR